MKLYGIVCEFNPLHRGHVFLLSEAQKRADHVVCLMSTSFVQRGEPAIFDCFTRARLALENGADAVLALPTVFSLQSAEFFAQGSVLSAQAVGCTHLLFGSESGELACMEQAVGRQPEKQKNLPYGKGYGLFENEPNHILGREYLTAIKAASAALAPETVRRKDGFASASLIRAALKEGKRSDDMISTGETPVFPESLFPLIRHTILSMPPEILHEICGVAEGLEYRIKKAAFSAQSRDAMIHAVKSKRYAYARIARSLCCALLGISKSDLLSCLQSPPPLRVLGVKKEKAELLSLLSNIYVSPRDAATLGKTAALSDALDRRAYHVRSVCANTPADTFDRTGLIKV